VESVSSSPDQGLVVMHGTADAWALKRRIWYKMKRRAHIVNDGSTPYYGPGATTAAPHYGSSQSYGYYHQQPAAAAAARLLLPPSAAAGIPLRCRRLRWLGGGSGSLRLRGARQCADVLHPVIGPVGRPARRG
jgi:hypothetical protein